MTRILLVPLLAAACLVAPAMLPQAFAPATTFGLSGSAEAATTVHGSRSNSGSFRTKQPKVKKVTKTRTGIGKRMGGGGGHSGGSGFIPGTDTNRY